MSKSNEYYSRAQEKHGPGKRTFNTPAPNARSPVGSAAVSLSAGTAVIFQENQKDSYFGRIVPEFFTMQIQFADVRGYRWKIWLMNEAKSEAGGIYLFENEESLKAFLGGPLISGVKNHPALSNFSVKHFDMLDAITKITRGPIEKRFRLEDLANR